MQARTLSNGVPKIRGDLMEIPTILVLQNHMESVEKMDFAICEIFKILIERIETLEAQVNDLQRPNDK